jgi:hypothetical protein
MSPMNLAILYEVADKVADGTSANGITIGMAFGLHVDAVEAAKLLFSSRVPCQPPRSRTREGLGFASLGASRPDRGSPDLL